MVMGGETPLGTAKMAPRRAAVGGTARLEERSASRIVLFSREIEDRKKSDEMRSVFPSVAARPCDTIVGFHSCWTSRILARPAR